VPALPQAHQAVIRKEDLLLKFHSQKFLPAETAYRKYQRNQNKEDEKDYFLQHQLPFVIYHFRE